MSQSTDKPLEIERKFLLRNDDWRALTGGSGRRLSQGYLCADAGRSVRVRIDGEKGTITVKGPREGISRVELQYTIPVRDAEILLGMCPRPLIDKIRHNVYHDGMKWEIDEFHGDNAGLIVAEVELESEDQSIFLPDWVGEEVSDQQRYYNSCLAKEPFSTWK